MERVVKIKDISVGKGNPLVLIAGPCVIESEKISFQTAEKIKKITQKLKIQVIYKSSYLKANRTSINSYTGPGLEKGLKILARIKKEFELPLLTDVHSREEIKPVAEVVDVIQIPAFLCRQTDLVVTAARTQKVLNLKKGQFLAPEDMAALAKKAESVGNFRLLFTERGTTFGYHNLVVDMRSLIIMKKIGYPVVYDATHSLQLPSAQGNSSGGQPRFILPLARAAVACGCDAVFVETHPQVSKALSDKESMLPLQKLKKFLIQLKELDFLRQKFINEN